MPIPKRKQSNQNYLTPNNTINNFVRQGLKLFGINPDVVQARQNYQQNRNRVNIPPYQVRRRYVFPIPGAYYNDTVYTRANDFGGGKYSGAGAGGEIYDNINNIPQERKDTIWIPTAVPYQGRGRTFNEAFAEARRQGKKTFIFNGKSYNTLLGNNPNNNRVGNQRVEPGGIKYGLGVIPVEY